MPNTWSTLKALPLSSPTADRTNYAVASVKKLDGSTVLVFDLRIHNLVKPTPNGVSMHLSEALWLNERLKNQQTGSNTNGLRILTFQKFGGDVFLTLNKNNNFRNQHVTLLSEEVGNLIACFDTLISVMQEAAAQLKPFPIIDSSMQQPGTGFSQILDGQSANAQKQA